MYNDYFLDYLDEKIGLKTIDDKLGKIGLFPPVNQDRKDIYQKFSKYNYFYIRNNLMIEKLDSSYIDELIERFNNNNFDYDDFAKNMIENTYVDVCDNYNIYGDISYGPTNGNFFAPANAIVLGCRADSRIKDGENVVEHFKKQGIIDDSIKTVNTNYRDEFDIPFKILMYDDYSDEWTQMYDERTDAWDKLYTLHQGVWEKYYDKDTDIQELLDNAVIE